MEKSLIECIPSEGALADPFSEGKARLFCACLRFLEQIAKLAKKYKWIPRGPHQPWAAGVSSPWCKPGISTSDLLPSEGVHNDFLSASFLVVLIGFYTNVSQNQRGV